MSSRRFFWVASAACAVLVLCLAERAQAQGVAADGNASQSEVETETSQALTPVSDVRPKARERAMPATRWTHQPRHVLWNRAALSALKAHGRPLIDMVPDDIDDWCPLYPDATEAQRRAFWLGFMSALAKYESTYKPQAVGGGGRWYGLLQILPATARGYECHAGSGAALTNGAANLSCAVRIMAVTVPRDGVVAGNGSRGVGADWGPLRSRAKRTEMSAWLKRQSYCTNPGATRPVTRPAKFASD